MASFLDYASDLFGAGGWQKLVAPAITSLLTRKQKGVDISALLPMYEQIAANARKAGAFADLQAGVYKNKFLPGAEAFSQEAQGIGRMPDQLNAAGRAAADFSQSQRMAEGAIRRRFPNNQTAQAAGMAQLQSMAIPNKINAMNQAMLSREGFGQNMRQAALNNFRVTPDYGAGANIAGVGMNVAGSINNMNRQNIADTQKTIQLPWDVFDENRRRQQDQANWDRQMAILDKFASR